MNKPKFSIGDSFLISKVLKQDDCEFKGEFSYFVVAVGVEGSAEGVTYKYGLSRDFPSAYHQPKTSLWLYEPSLSTHKQVGSYFG